MQSGAFGNALELLAGAEAQGSGPLDEFASARVDLLRGQVAFASSRGSDAPSLLLKAAKRFEPLDRDLARDTYLTAWIAATFAGRLAAIPMRHFTVIGIETLAFMAATQSPTSPAPPSGRRRSGPPGRGPRDSRH